MTQTGPLVAAIVALLLAGCAGPGAEQVSPEQREALNDEMLEPDSLSGGYMPGMGIGNF